jgi:prepilin-type N-terminal cleavage/methylation domain-containing protein
MKHRAHIARRAHGMTLVELVIAITVIAIAVTSVLGLLSSIAVRSANAMTSTQSAAIASAYLDEALSKAYTPAGNAAGRANLNDVLDYNFTDVGARDANNNAIPNLNAYSVQINAGFAVLGAIPDAIRVDVTVTAPNGTVTQLTGFRTNYVGHVIRP